MTGERISLGGISVALAMPIYRDIDPKTVKSLMTTQQLMHSLGIGFNFINSQGAYVERQRNLLAKMFLEGDYNRLFCIDSDMVWKPEEFLRLLTFSTELEVVGATYRFRDDPVRFVLVTPKEWDPGVLRRNRFGCVTYPGIALGLGFTCIQRKVIEELATSSPRVIVDTEESIYAEIFYSSTPVTGNSRARGVGGQITGEDVNFFLDVQAMGYDVWLDPGIELGHVGSKVYKAKPGDHIDFGVQP